MGVVLFGVEARGIAVSGRGQTRSLTSGEQKIPILSWRYHLLCNDNPGSVMVSGNSFVSETLEVSWYTVSLLSLYKL